MWHKYIFSGFKSQILGFKSQAKLHWVRIYFADPTFDRITKDEKANYVAKLSAIGGTMGLLTGFSLISGVECLFFAAKIVMGLIRGIKKTKINSHHTVIMIESAEKEEEANLELNIVDLVRKRTENKITKWGNTSYLCLVFIETCE